MSATSKKVVTASNDETTINFKNKDYLATVYSVGKAYYDAGKYDKAITIFRFLCLVDLTNYKYFTALATIQISLKLTDKAISTLAYAVELKDAEPQGAILLAQMLIEQKKFHLASQAANKAIAISNTNPEKWADEKKQAESLINKIDS